MGDRPRCIDPAEARGNQCLGTGVEIGDDMPLDPRLERPVPIEREVQFLAVIGD
jgi:hypothetical protein